MKGKGTETATRGLRVRRKLWEIREGYHCSIIGVCLSRGDLYKLAQKRLFQIRSGAGDYDIHAALMTEVATRNPRSRVLQKMFDARYKTAINRYAQAGNDEEIWRLWVEDAQCGRFAGPYWAVMSHPLASGELRSRVYGRIHMKGYELFTVSQSMQRDHEELRSKHAVLEEVVVSERQSALREKKGLEQQLERLRLEHDEHAAMHEELQRLRQEVSRLQRQLARESLWRELQDVKEKLNEKERNNGSLARRVEEFRQQLESSEQAAGAARQEIAHVRQEVVELRAERQELQHEIGALESALLAKMGVSYECGGCDWRDTDHCPGPQLCGRTVLYVGGNRTWFPATARWWKNMAAASCITMAGRSPLASYCPKCSPAPMPSFVRLTA